MEAHQERIDWNIIQEYEKKFRHDVMAHIHAFGDACPKAKPIIHLGATSSFVTDNADLILLREGLSFLFAKLQLVLQALAKLARGHAKDPCLSYTHFQPAQPTTIGKRIALYLQDFYIDAKEWLRLISEIPFFGVKGATGTQASFLELLDENHAKVLTLEKEVAAAFGFDHVLPIGGQTYTRKIDIQILSALASFAASAHKFATDLRLLAHEGEWLETFEKDQVGSSAMPYKRNPIYSERICGIARFAISIAENPSYTTATQWLERSLDDSSNRRIAVPEAFLCADAILNLLLHLATGSQIKKEVALERLNRQLPLMAMEGILMLAVKKGGSRQETHEILRKIAFHAIETTNPLATLIQEVEKKLKLSESEIKSLLQPHKLVGRAPEQTIEFLNETLDPFIRHHLKKSAPIFLIEN